MAKNQNQQKVQKPVAAKPNTGKKLKQDAGISLSTKLAILLAVIALTVYANSLSNGFALDDSTVIKSNTIVTKGISAIPQIFTTPYRRGWFITNNDLYRPLSLAMFAVEYQLSEGSPFIGHFMNVAIFVGCVVLLFLFFDGFFDGRKTMAAFVAALFFAIHPVHTEVVANIKSRDELLCFFFAFLSLNIFLKYAQTGKLVQLIIASFCLFLSLLSKETGITLIAIIPLVFFFYSNQNKKRSINLTGAAVLVAAIFLALRYLVLKSYDANTSSYVTFMDNMLTGAPSAMSQLATEILILGQYVKLLFIPYPLLCDYSFSSIPFTAFSDVRVLISLAGYLLLAAWGLFRLFKLPRDGYAFGMLFFLITISLFSNIPFLIGSAMAERFLFFPSVGFCLVLALLVERYLMDTNKPGISALTNAKTMLVIAPVALIFSGITIDRNSDWKDNTTLFTADIKHAPKDARLNYYLGTEMSVERAKAEQNPVAKQQVIDSGIAFLKKALSVYRDYDDANASLGDAYFRTSRYDSAEYYDKRALVLNPKYTIAINNLAGIYFVKGNYPSAIEYCHEALKLNPVYANAYNNLGLCYIRLNQLDSALTNLNKSIAIDPNATSPYENLVIAYNALGKADSVNKYNNILHRLKGSN